MKKQNGKLKSGQDQKAGKLFLAKILPLFFWLGVWYWASLAIGNELILVSPLKSLERLAAMLREASFWFIIARSCLRILLGFCLGLISGMILAAAARRFKALDLLLSPFMQAVKAVPVASVIILLLIWISSRRLSVIVAFMMVLPLVYNNLRAGLEALDPQLDEMARLFDVPWTRRLYDLILPQLLPFLMPAVQTGFGFAFKSGIAAEVIGIPDGSIGEKLYKAKIYLDTADLFAWTIVIVLLSFLFEGLFVHLLNALQNAILKKEV